MRVLLLLTVIGVLAVGCRETEETRGARVEGAELYAANCAVCHGPTGDGSGQVPSRVDFTSRSWQQYRTDAEIRSAIQNGVQGAAMPAFPALNDEQLDALVAHLRELKR